MRLLFTKYYSPISIYGINYFTSTDIQVEDYLVIDEVPSNAFPLFRDEMLRDNDSVVYQAGEFDLQLSLMDFNVLSNAGKTVREFFELRDRKCIRCITEIGAGNPNNRVGFVDVTSFDFNNNWDEDEESQTVSFTVYSAEAELIRGMENYSYRQLWDMYHHTFDGSNIWQWVTELTRFFRVGFSLQQNLTAGINSKCSPINKMFWNWNCKDCLISLFKGFGLLFKVLPRNGFYNPGEWNYLMFKVFNRKTSIDSRPAVEILEASDHHELRQGVDENLQFYGIPHVKLLQGEFTEGDNYRGIVSARRGSANNSREYVRMSFYPSLTPGSTQRIWIFTKPTGFPFGIWDFSLENGLLIIDIDMVEKNLNVLKESLFDQVQWSDGSEITELSFCRVFVKDFTLTRIPIGNGFFILQYSDSGADEVAKEFVDVDTYSYLIATYEKVKELEVKALFNFDILAFQKAIINNELYLVERVYDIDIIQKLYRLQLIKMFQEGRQRI